LSASTPAARSLFETLTCTRCGATHDPDAIQTICREAGCGRPLVARYALEELPRPAPEAAASPVGHLWRYPELMPITARTELVSLGEGGTPLLPAMRLGRELGLRDLWLKDESGNPTGSFKARGLAVAAIKAKELGAETIALPTAGNAGGAAAAYAARIGLACVVVMPSDTPAVFKREVVAFGGRLVEHEGLIDDCGRIVAEHVARDGWYDVSTLKEPYRVEGKKTMGIEIAEQLGWALPDVVIYPTGGGTGLVGMWKAWAELEAVGWIGPERPRMYAVQPTGCAPVVRAFDTGAERCERVEGAQTIAAGLRVPRPFADEWILAVLRKSGGGAVAVSDEEITAGVDRLARLEGIFAAPEVGATWAAVEALVRRQEVSAADRIVIVATGSAYKYL
jgi:threonine synthase